MRKGEGGISNLTFWRRILRIGEGAGGGEGWGIYHVLKDTTSSITKCGKAFLSCALRLKELVPTTLKKKDETTINNKMFGDSDFATDPRGIHSLDKRGFSDQKNDKMNDRLNKFRTEPNLFTSQKIFIEPHTLKVFRDTEFM